MTRFLKLLVTLAFLAPLPACGIKGNLKTPPPVWGDKAEDPATNEAGEAAPEDTLEEDEDDVGYGIDVAETP